MNDREFDVTDKQFEQAEKRHEDKYQEELENVDIRAVTLKTKKAVLEQARINARCEQAAIDQQYEIRALRKIVDNYIYRLEGTEKLLSKQHKIFTEAIALLSNKEKKETAEDVEDKRKKGFFGRLFKWMK